MKNMLKQTIGFIALCLTLFGCQKPKPEVIIKTVLIYRDTCDSDFQKKIAQIETGGLDSLAGENGAGRGRYGIYEICVIGSGLDALLNYNHKDMHIKEKSDHVFWAMVGIFAYQYWQRHGHPPTYEDLARMWSGGPMGYQKKATLHYLNKFRKL